MLFFTDLFSAADAVLDSVFAGPATYRAAGVALSVTASVRSEGIGQDQDRDGPQSWLGYVVELYRSDLTINGRQWDPIGGDEIAFPQDDGSLKVYKVTANKDGRTFEPLDIDQVKILVFAKLIRTEQ
jgi:hypothetical protein